MLHMSLRSYLFTKVLYLLNVLFRISLLCVLRYMDINMILMFCHFPQHLFKKFGSV